MSSKRMLDSDSNITENITSLTRGHNMSNYTAKMVDAIKAASPLDLGKAKDLAADFGVSHRSVISKAISLGVQYNKQPAKAKSVRTTKADMVAAIRKAASLPDRQGDLTKDDLTVILSLIS